MTHIREDHFEGKAATLENYRGTHYMLTVDGEEMFNQEWHHIPKRVKGDWYAVRKGSGWEKAYVKINENVARHATFLEALWLGGFASPDLLPMTPNKSAQKKGSIINYLSLG